MMRFRTWRNGGILISFPWFPSKGEEEMKALMLNGSWNGGGLTKADRDVGILPSANEIGASTNSVR